MNDRELEQRVRNWYRAEIGEDAVAPLALRRDVAAIPRSAPESARPLGGRTRLTLLVAAAFLVVGGVVAVGAELVRLSSVLPPVTLPSPSVVAQPTALASTTAPSPTPDGALPASAGMFAHPGSFLLASDTVGWVATADAIYRTRDMGNTWTAAQPAGWTAIGRAQFIDADTAYAIEDTGAPPTPLTIAAPVTIAATHDGGASWIEATIDGPAGMAGMGMSFRNGQEGFITFFSQTGADLRIFETTDGGRSWTGPARSAAPRMLYLLKDLSGDPASGGHALVLTNSLAPGRAFDNNVYFSLDGGATWARRPFPVSHRAPAAKMKGAALWADGSGRVVLSMDVQGDVQVYSSDDGGQSWGYVIDLGRDVGHEQLLSATEWVFMGSSVLSTVDGGANWRTTEISATIDVFGVSFASSDRGWAILSCYDNRSAYGVLYCQPSPSGGNNDTVLLLGTTDGGRTWTRIGG